MSYNFLLALGTSQSLGSLATDCKSVRITNNVETYFGYRESAYNPNCGQCINIIIRLADSDVAWLDNLQHNVADNVNNRYKNSFFFSTDEVQEIIDSAIADFAPDGELLFSYDLYYFGNDPENINYFHLMGTRSYNDEIDYFLTKENIIRLLFLLFPCCVNIICLEYVQDGDPRWKNEDRIFNDWFIWYPYSYEYDTDAIPSMFFTYYELNDRKLLYDRHFLDT